MSDPERKMNERAPADQSLLARVQALEDLIRNHNHKGYDLTPQLLRVPLKQVQILDNSVLGDGKTRSGTLELKIAAGKGDAAIFAGLDAGDFANAAAKTGFIIGVDDSDSDTVKFYFGTPGNSIVFDGTTLTVSGALSVGSLDIPDTSTTNSFHVETDGDTFWGATNANFTSDNDNAPAYVLKTGFAKFQNVQIGGTTLQYQIVDTGNNWFGNGSDGAVDMDGTNTFSFASKSGSAYTLTADVYATTMTIRDGSTLNTAGYRIFCTTSLTVGEGTSGIISRDGVAGSNGSNGENGVDSSGTDGQGGGGGAGGTALGDGYLRGSVAGAAGGAGGDGYINSLRSSTVGTAGTAGTAVSNSLGSDGSAGGNGGGSDGTSQSKAGGSGGTGGTATAANVALIASWHLETMLDIGSTGATVKFTNSAGAAGGGGGGGGGAEVTGTSAGGGGGGGGGAGSNGGSIVIRAKSITVNANAIVRAIGGDGGTGGNGGNGDILSANIVAGGGGGGGGAGGDGGQIILVYNDYTNNGTVSVAAGSAGSAGSGGAGYDGGTPNGTYDGSNGAAGSAGSAGNVRQFQISGI